MFKDLRNFLNGLAFGITETIPGVSGGTIAIILGFYNELIETVNHFTEDYRKYLRFLFPLIIGIAAGILLFSSIINFLLANFSFPTMSFFIGLIAGIIPHIFSKVKEQGQRFKPKEILLILIPFLLLLVISGLKGVSVTNPEEVINNIDVPFMIFIFFGNSSGRGTGYSRHKRFIRFATAGYLSVNYLFCFMHQAFFGRHHKYSAYDQYMQGIVASWNRCDNRRSFHGQVN